MENKLIGKFYDSYAKTHTEELDATKHSPLPWTMENDSNAIGEPVLTVFDADKEEVCHDDTYYNRTPMPHDVAFIVHCVNHHDKLIDMLHRAAGVILGGDSVSTDEQGAIYREIETLLNSARL